MRTRKQMALTIGAFFAFTMAAAAEKPQVTICTSSRFLATSFISRSANVRLIVRMEKNERNWELEVRCDGVDGGVSTASTKSFWNGDRQRGVYDLGFDLSPATYRCEAVLLRKQEDGKMKNFTSSVEVTVH